MTDRAEHLQWAKDRAKQLVALGDHVGAVTSMISDLNKSSDFDSRVIVSKAQTGMLVAIPEGREGVLKWIDSFE